MIYQRTIDLGGHPNERAVTRGRRYIRGGASRAARAGSPLRCRRQDKSQAIIPKTTAQAGQHD